jgi:hypothetical protein
VADAVTEALGNYDKLKQEEDRVMKTAKSVFLMIVSLIALGVMPPAWANQHAAGYETFMDNGCTLQNGGDICSTGNFSLPAATRIADNMILGFVLDCTDLGNGIDFVIDLHVNGSSVKSYPIGSSFMRGVWEVLGGNALALNNNRIEFVAGTPFTGSCNIADLVVQFRMTTVP